MKSSFLSGGFNMLAGVASCLAFSMSGLSVSVLIAGEFPASADLVTAVATVNGESISDSELTAVAGGQLWQLHLQEYQVRKEALETLLNQKVIEAEARRKGIATDKLLEQEVDSKVGEISNSELNAYYLGQKDRLNRPFAEIEQQLRAALRQSGIQQARQDYVKTLRESAKVAILLRPPKAAVSVDPGRVRGSAKVPVTIVEFSDYQCPYCQAVEATLKQVLAQYEGRVSLAYRDFPLSPIHPQAQIAAEASRCAADRGKFWEYHDALFANQSLLQQQDLIASAHKLGIDEKDFESCLTSGKFRSAVQSDYQDGLRAGVTGTPAFFINGIYLNGNQPVAEFARVIQDELAAISLRSPSAALPPGKDEVARNKH